MGHARTYFTFGLNTPEKKIRERVSSWCYANMDLEEAGWPSKESFEAPIRWERAKVFDSLEEAADYAESHASYGGHAVRYKEYPKSQPSKAITELQRRIEEYRNRIAELNKPHYQGVKSATIKCKKCGAVLPTSYCGKSYYNNCPVCCGELRPQSTLDKIAGYTQTVSELREKLDAEIKQQNKKNEAKAVIKWCVGCDVHC